MTHENRFGNNGTESAGSGEPNDSGDQMNEKDEDLTHSGDGIKASKTVGTWPFLSFATHSYSWKRGSCRMFCRNSRDRSGTPISKKGASRELTKLAKIGYIGGKE